MKGIVSAFCLLCIASLPINAQVYTFYEPISSFFADLGTLERKYTLKKTTEYHNRIGQLYQDWQAFLDEVDYESLDKNGKIDYHLFRNHLRKQLFLLEDNKAAFEQVAFVTGFADELYDFVRNRRRGKTVDGFEKGALFHRMTVLFTDASEELPLTEPFDTWIIAGNAANVVRDLRENLDEAYRFYYGYHPEFTWWTEAPYNKLAEQILQYEEALRAHYKDPSLKDDGSGITGRPAGKQALIKRLQYEFIPYSPEELILIGQQQLQFCRDEMKQASREMGFGEDWRAALEYVKDQYVPPGEQPELINRLAEEAIAFIEENDLLSIPELARETWRMEMMSPERQLFSPFFLGGERISISYPTHTMAHDAKMMSLRGNNPHFCMATVHHELIAGHHLQGFMNQRYKPYRRRMGTPFWTEGWALYWEFLLYEKGLPPTPEDRMGFLFWRKHRAARIIFSLKYHLEKMTPQECIDFIVHEVGHERANAEAEVRRSFMGGYDILYQLAYMIGGIQFQELRKELVDTEKMSFREFHDSVLMENNIPVELLRVLLTGEDISRDFNTSWRFADEYINK